MTIIGIDDTDSRTKGMCTTYVGHRIADKLRNEYDASVSRILLTRLNPAAKHKTRGNASVTIHADVSKEDAVTVVDEMLSKFSVVDDDNTNPGAVITDMDKIPEEVSNWTNRAMHTLLDISEAEEIIEKYGFESIYYGNGRGRIGSLAGVGAWDAFDDWTYEHISYRNQDVRGTERDVNADSVFKAANEYHPQVWDTVDRTAGDIVCVPHTPCPILHGIRGDVKSAVESVAQKIESEPVESRQTFMTNQGTDVHLENARLEDIVDDSAYVTEGIVKDAPETRKGGHVFFEVESPRNPQETVTVAAFEPTKHFRNYVRDLKEGDYLKICGGITDGTLKLEKFKCVELNNTKLENPQCEDCDRSMGSMGANQGYRCRSCGYTEPSKVKVEIDRKLEEKCWYEVPPCARRHVSKPLIRGGYQDKTHPLI